uniref:Mitochondrial import inner membrane translocase subunit TIM50 n=1 Tax=Xenopus tropicalis TaxID=8364 RepID=A0A6I8S308_XENTR
MILRSRKIPAQPLKDLHTPRKKSEGNSPKTPRSAARVPKRVQPKSPCTPSGTFSKKTTARLTNICLNSPNAEDLKTPMRERSVRVHFQFDDPFPGKQDLVSSIYTPVLTYLSTQDEDSDGCNVPTKNCLYFNHIPVDRTREDFNPYKFICNIQQTPCDQRQRGKDIPFKTRSAPESTLVLDLVYVKLRPHAMEFLETLCKVYEIFVFTTAKKEYAEKILDLLDPQKKLIRHRLFQDQCLCVEGHYVKDLGILQRDLAKTVALDTAPHTIPYHLANRIPIQSWKGSKKDRGLLSLLSTLEKMTLVDDVRLVISHQFKIKDLVAED